VRAEQRAGELVVEEYHTGVRAAAERLVGARMIMRFARVLLRREPDGYSIPWQQLDLSDPRHPRATVPKADLGH
jgi:hypothetical protein